MKNRQISLADIAAFSALAIGIALMAFPIASDLLFRISKDRTIGVYSNSFDAAAAEAMLDRAYAYNRQIASSEESAGHYPSIPDDMRDDYSEILNPLGNGVMGYIEIPSLDVILPIYHGTAEEVLQNGAGHITGTSLPVGSPDGTPSHAAIAAHSGLPGRIMFDNLDRLEEGSWFSISILDSVLWYEVDQMKTVLPAEAEELIRIEPGDRVTLVTCTPYGVNDHRLLVIGVRSDGPDSKYLPSSESYSIPLAAAFILACGITALMISGRRRHQSIQAGNSDNSELL